MTSTADIETISKDAEKRFWVRWYERHRESPDLAGIIRAAMTKAAPGIRAEVLRKVARTFDDEAEVCPQWSWHAGSDRLDMMADEAEKEQNDGWH